ncbi:chaperone protein dnaJ 11, chloroplastic-like [Phoenix dactylifera]|uniref:Chaperone protein dnaJ 11, chloroplastic-like n=1 Tax=Phoenix dactylifera TaxID=42345 RepID=A0A8B8ZK48_PHODC|nr:chaperone protein dnaJ 11, chloroplastic-like [Phoenix dactylifera]
MPILSSPDRFSAMMITTSSQFLGLRITPSTPRSVAPSSPRSATSLRSPGISAAYTAAAERQPPAAALPPALQSSFASLYDVLGLPSGATGQEIKAAYRRLALARHPDVVATDRKGTSADEFIRIHAAYSTLSDPEKRADYDRKLLLLGRHRRTVRHSSPPTPSSSSSFRPFSRSPSFPSYGRRTWETDQCW